MNKRINFINGRYNTSIRAGNVAIRALHRITWNTNSVKDTKRRTFISIVENITLYGGGRKYSLTEQHRNKNYGSGTLLYEAESTNYKTI